MGSIGFTPLAQGLLTDKFLGGRHEEHATKRRSFNERMLSEDNLRRLEGLNAIAADRGQSLAQMAIAWALRTVTSALIGASRTEQIDENLAALDNLEFSDEELRRIDEFAGDAGVNIWATSSDL